jgi:hypothetical protein
VHGTIKSTRQGRGSGPSPSRSKEARWDEALEDAADRLEAEAFRRAVRGVDRPVVYRGERVGTVHEFSDALLMFLLKAARPEKYRDRFDPKKLIRAALRA